MENLFKRHGAYMAPPGIIIVPDSKEQLVEVAEYYQRLDRASQKTNFDHQAFDDREIRDMSPEGRSLQALVENIAGAPNADWVEVQVAGSIPLAMLTFNPDDKGEKK